jgi:hypothetical protein
VATTDFLFNASRKTGFFNDDITEDSSLTEKARKTFYRLNGADYRTAAPPRGVREWERNNFNEQTDQGTAINQGLSLSGSQIDGSIDGDTALAYLEWTLILKKRKIVAAGSRRADSASARRGGIAPDALDKR